jgi:hypothetical protein
MAGDELTVRSGQVIALRLFDLAYEIDLKRVEDLWAERTRGASARSRLVGTPPKAVSFGVPPLALELGGLPITIGGRSVTVAVSVRLYDFGLTAFALCLPVEDLPWPDYVKLVNATDLAIGPTAATPVWEGLLAQLRTQLG